MLKKISPLILLSLVSCSLFIEPMPKGWNYKFLQPRPLTGIKNFPPADTDYGKGFKDGCAAAFDSVGKGLITEYNYAKFDYKRSVDNPDYKSGWWDGYEQCTYIIDHDVV